MQREVLATENECILSMPDSTKCAHEIKLMQLQHREVVDTLKKIKIQNLESYLGRNSLQDFCECQYNKSMQIKIVIKW